ncbi:hypothetical protein LTS15_010897 [Exophiala xenobiotica]|nr:hypothetical protein LTS15_010897 [Exophiala xenobiotica]
MGYRVIAIDLGVSKREYCLELGAEAYFDAKQVDAAAIQKLTGDGAAAVLVMANSSRAYEAALEFVAPYGVLFVSEFHHQISKSGFIHSWASRRTFASSDPRWAQGRTSGTPSNLTSENFQKTSAKYVIRFRDEDDEAASGAQANGH